MNKETLKIELLPILFGNFSISIPEGLKKETYFPKFNFMGEELAGNPSQHVREALELIELEEKERDANFERFSSEEFRIVLLLEILDEARKLGVIPKPTPIWKEESETEKLEVLNQQNFKFYFHWERDKTTSPVLNIRAGVVAEIHMSIHYSHFLDKKSGVWNLIRDALHTCDKRYNTSKFYPVQPSALVAYDENRIVRFKYENGRVFKRIVLSEDRDIIIPFFLKNHRIREVSHSYTCTLKDTVTGITATMQGPSHMLSQITRECKLELSRKVWLFENGVAE